ncbi:MAG: hypothetical protein WBD86_02590 [Microgenomates group bacterium]
MDPIQDKSQDTGVTTPTTPTTGADQPVAEGQTPPITPPADQPVVPTDQPAPEKPEATIPEPTVQETPEPTKEGEGGGVPGAPPAA